jgi:hypothetical protein
MSRTSIRVKGVKINTLIPPASLVGLVPPEPAPAGNPTLESSWRGPRSSSGRPSTASR